MGLREVRIILSDHFHLVPSEVVLSAVEQKLAGVSGRENKLFEKLRGLEDEYDFVLIDCPPNLGLLTFNALRASKELIIPVECSSYSLHGLTGILETVKVLEEAIGCKLIVRALLNDFDLRTRFSRKIQEELLKMFSNRLFHTVIHHSVRLREAAACGRPISEYDRESIVFKDFLNLSTEVIEEGIMPQIKVSLDTFDIPRFEDQESSWIAPVSDRESEEHTYSVLFTIRVPSALSVQIAGDFNHWVAEELRAPIKEGGVWRKLYHLKKGIYKYKFLVDGEWITDPQNPRSEPNSFGGADSILDVGTQEICDGR